MKKGDAPQQSCRASGCFWEVLVTTQTVGMDQKAIGWIDPGALLIGLFCDPALVVSSRDDLGRDT